MFETSKLRSSKQQLNPQQRQLFYFITWLVITACILIAGASCKNQISQTSQTNTNLLVSAAASLKETLEEIKPLYQQTQTNKNITYNFGASGALQQQIENGAPVDIFISASKKQMDALEAKNLLIKETRRNLLTNRLVLIVPKSSKSSVGLSDFRQLTDPKIKKIAIGELKSVPAGQYAEEVLTKLGILEQVKPKLVLGNNVRQVLSTVASGNADAGIVYLTDAKTSPQVKIAAIAENLHSPIVYPVAILKSSKNVDAAKEYLQLLSSNQAKSIFEKYGFGINAQ
ncbi:MAG: molybdate ABC transporter substrate-binding protein [Coleofasciculaceae cyanobacterium]